MPQDFGAVILLGVFFMPYGSLTPTQHQLLRVIWNNHPHGITISEIWEHIVSERSVKRTTILNLVNRLEKRRWLVRQMEKDAYRYNATMGRKETAQWLVCHFVSDYFGGSSVNSLTSLLADERFRTETLDALSKLLIEHRETN